MSEYLHWLSPLLLLLGGCTGLWNFRTLPTPLRYLVLFLWLNLAIDLCGRFSAAAWNYNLWLIPVMAGVELGIFTQFFHAQFKKRRPLLRLVCLLSTLYFGVEALLHLFIEFGQAPETRILATSLIGWMSLVYFLERVEHISHRYFRLHTVLFFYYSVSSVLFIPMQFLVFAEGNSKFYFWVLNFILTLGLYLMLIFELWKHGKKARKSHSGLPAGYFSSPSWPSESSE